MVEVELKTKLFLEKNYELFEILFFQLVHKTL